MDQPHSPGPLTSVSVGLTALTHAPSPHMDECQLTHLERLPIDHALARQQHDEYCRALAGCGAKVRILTANLQYPDCAFIEDTAIVLDEVALLTSMGAISRRAEPAGVEPELRKHREVRRIELPATLEGGDVLRVGRKLLAGLSGRTNRAGMEALAAVARRHGYEVIPVTPRRCLHLKSACTALPDGRLLANLDWLEPQVLRGFDVISVAASEPSAANVVVVGDHMVAGAQNPETIGLLRESGFRVQAVELSEFAKAEGAVTCLSLIIPQHVNG